MDIFIPISTLIFFFLLFSISKPLLQKCRNLPPSPPSIPILGHLHLIKKPLHRSLTTLSDHYSPILSLCFGSRPVLLVSTPSLAEECLSKNDIIFANRPHILAGKHINYNYSAIGLASYGPHWHNLRRILTIKIFSSSCIQMFSVVRIQEVRSLVKDLFRDSELGKSVVELKSKFSELTLKVMMGMIAGKRYYGDNVVDLEEAKWFQGIVKEALVLSGASYIGDFLPFLGWMDLGGVEKRMVRMVKDRDEFLQVLIDEHRRRKKNDNFSSSMEEEVEVEKKKKKKKTFIDVMLSLQETEPEYYIDQIIKGMLGALLNARTDTSALTTEWAMSLLLNHPDVLGKAKAELDMHVGPHSLDESDLAKLPYLHCIINETLRLYPVAPLLLPHESSEESIIGGFNVPPGTMLWVNVWAIHRDPKVWMDPTNFKLERFQGIEGAKEGLKLIPFGYGRRACPSMGLDMRMMSLAMGTLIQCFEWEKRVGEEKVDMTEGPGLTMPQAQPLVSINHATPCSVYFLSSEYHTWLWAGLDGIWTLYGYFMVDYSCNDYLCPVFDMPRILPGIRLCEIIPCIKHPTGLIF
ncbi:cytochrome P450 81Q32-like [Magnolia sinica]|uniref:cytochrome P450 81Q32-like n=1 Tax=Magnolia sinica TaxID=86752 RepID=UPI00265A2195|nr:cytochrome P450 81Q32-like [Magnolia sinica]